MQFFFASGQVSVFGDTGICQQRMGASLHYYFSAYSRSLLTLKAETLYILCFAFFVKVRSHWLGCWGHCGVVRLCLVAASHMWRCGVGMGWVCAASQLVCSGLYSAGDSLFLFFFYCFFLGVTTLRVARFFFVCVYYYLHIACFNALSFPPFLEFLFLLMCSTVPSSFSRIKSLIDWCVSFFD